MAQSGASEVLNAVSKLKAERQTHVKAIAEIDDVFAQLGLKVRVPAKREPKPGKKKPGRPKGSGTVSKKKSSPKKQASGQTKRKKFKVPGTQAILDVVKASGKAGTTTGTIVKAWEKQGRGGAPYTTIGELVDEGKLRRKSLKGKRGSLYTLK